jgi:hypothetical protein
MHQSTRTHPIQLAVDLMQLPSTLATCVGPPHQLVAFMLPFTSPRCQLPSLAVLLLTVLAASAGRPTAVEGRSSRASPNTLALGPPPLRWRCPGPPVLVAALLVATAPVALPMYRERSLGA